ncbi:hypothetical protein ACFOSC_21345 [Streptantibioticus rubrisoli]|uniref:Rhodopsin n=1 Tax=Streptantibioticus rubrisoli TaxID=1387313 RepID=A0ABT1P561_9ACTN|nr:hypothetical protein [Streptantibioticus rubrisoli]MCQ4040508.1 hypothetical protein [Streptantibioticus rubrisoli]
MSDQVGAPAAETAKSSSVLLVVVWLWVTAPFVYGIYELTLTVRKLFLK